jgi:hypothetical protein
MEKSKMLATEINNAIRQGLTVTAIAADVQRKHQPRSGTQIVVTEAFERGSEIRVYARGFEGRFRVTDVAIDGETESSLRADAGY